MTAILNRMKNGPLTRFNQILDFPTGKEGMSITQLMDQRKFKFIKKDLDKGHKVKVNK